MLQENDTIPYVNIEYIRKGIKAEQNEDWSALDEDRSLILGWSERPGSDVKRHQQV